MRHVSFLLATLTLVSLNACTMQFLPASINGTIFTSRPHQVDSTVPAITEVLTVSHLNRSCTGTTANPVGGDVYRHGLGEDRP